MRRALIGLIFCLCAVSGPAAQGLPPPVTLNVPNVVQETPVWCWVAVARQLILANQGQAPNQCALVAIANGAHPNVCCSGYNPACVKTGAIPQMAGLIQMFGRTATAYAPPADAMTLYRTLRSGRAVILQVRSGATSTHVVVLRGMSFVQTPYGVEAVLHINDPMSFFTQPVPFSQLLPLWIDAVVVDVRG